MHEGGLQSEQTVLMRFRLALRTGKNSQREKRTQNLELLMYKLPLRFTAVDARNVEITILRFIQLPHDNPVQYNQNDADGFEGGGVVASAGAGQT